MEILIAYFLYLLWIWLHVRCSNRPTMKTFNICSKTELTRISPFLVSLTFDLGWDHLVCTCIFSALQRKQLFTIVDVIVVLLHVLCSNLRDRERENERQARTVSCCWSNTARVTPPPSNGSRPAVVLGLLGTHKTWFNVPWAAPLHQGIPALIHFDCQWRMNSYVD